MKAKTPSRYTHTWNVQSCSENLAKMLTQTRVKYSEKKITEVKGIQRGDIQKVDSFKEKPIIEFLVVHLKPYYMQNLLEGLLK